MDRDFEEELVYLRRNGENISDPSIIENCKLEQNRDIIENARLGSYDKYGNYIFMPEIRFELINIPKFIYHFSSLENKKIFDLKTIIPIFGELFFKLTISDKEAVFYLVETVSRESGGYMEVYEEVVDAIALGKMNNLLTEDIFSMYHIYENDADEDKQTFFIYDYINLLTRKIYLTLLSKELSEEMLGDEHETFNSMIAFLKDGGEYGKKVLNEFVARLKDRPEIFEMENTEKYNKAVNEVLLSALDIVTTQKDKEDVKIKEIYLNVLNARNKNVDKHIENAHKKVEKEYVQDVAKRAIIVFNEDLKQGNLTLMGKDAKVAEHKNELESEKLKNREVVKNFYDKLVNKQKSLEKHITQKAVLKQGKEIESTATNALGALTTAKNIADKNILSPAKNAVKAVSTAKSASIEKQAQAKPETKPVAKTASKAGGKSASKSGGKSASKSGGKSKVKTASKSGGKQALKTVEKKVEKSVVKKDPKGAVKLKVNDKSAQKPNVEKNKSPVGNLKVQEEKQKTKRKNPLFENKLSISGVGGNSEKTQGSRPSSSLNDTLTKNEKPSSKTTVNNSSLKPTEAISSLKAQAEKTASKGKSEDLKDNSPKSPNEEFISEKNYELKNQEMKNETEGAFVINNYFQIKHFSPQDLQNSNQEEGEKVKNGNINKNNSKLVGQVNVVDKDKEDSLSQ